MDRSQNSYSVTPSVSQGPLNALITWEAVANCSGNLTSVTYFTTGNVTTSLMDNATTGFFPVVVCPSPSSMLFNPNKFSTAFVIFLDVLRMNFLRMSLCLACTSTAFCQ
ncbi:hypothetical protein BDR07DRAFT_493458 [Suillus spraguei]|nr:hypothetical protein BDR07DRAFT_493458 [Suillus spraguei]